MSKKFSSVFFDPAWLVASLAGAWGVVISMEEFIAADFLAIAAAVVICLKLGSETHLSRKDRKPLVFAVAFIIVVSIIGLDLRWTNQKRREARERSAQLAQLIQIPNLKEKLQQMEEAQNQRDRNEELRQAKAGQKLDDIEQENKDLRKSVETKDAALVSIAKDQYALNFFPQIVISTNGSADKMYITNNGKTNVEIYRTSFDGHDGPDGAILQTIAPTAIASFTTSAQTREVMLQRARATNSRVPVEGSVYILTLDKRHYRMSYTWYFETKDEKIDKSYILDGPIVEEK
jgi:hypothetical protein